MNNVSPSKTSSRPHALSTSFAMKIGSAAFSPFLAFNVDSSAVILRDDKEQLVTIFSLIMFEMSENCSQVNPFASLQTKYTQLPPPCV